MTKGFRWLIRLGDRLLNAVLIAAAAALLFISAYSLVDNLRLYQQASDPSLLTYKPALDAPIDNSHVISDKQAAWLNMYYTTIDYPVMQGDDNFEFLNTDPYGEFRLSGSIFLDWRNSKDFSDEYSLLYGHHMEHGVMFGSLDYFTDINYFENHRNGRLVTMKDTYELVVFAVSYALGDDGTIFSPRETTARQVLDYLEMNALIFTGYEEGKRIVALSTCAGETDLSRLIVFCYIR